MSWVLILNSPIVAKPPAVIGGYQTREEAEQAGECATAYAEPDGVLKQRQAPDFTSYTVIPGAACSEPLGWTHCKTDQDWDSNMGTIVNRYIYRSPIS